MSQARDSGPPAAVDFTTFVLSLSTAALEHLAQPGPAGSAAGKPDLALAQQTIDILAMLEAKTQGNLTEAEAKLLGHILYDLRMRYVEARRT